MKKTILKLALLPASTLVALALAEVILLIIGYPNPLDYDPIYRASSVPGLVYELKPHFRGKERYGVPVATNSIGLREETEFTQEPPPGVRRIALLGDSITFGHGMTIERTFARLLEERISRMGGPGKWEVMNFGVSGYSASKMVIAFREKALAYVPQVAVLALIENDFSPNRDAMTVTGDGYLSVPGSFLSGHMGIQTVLRKLRLAAVLKSVLTRASSPPEDHAAGGISGAPLEPAYRKCVRGTVEEFGSLSRTHGVRGLVAWVSLTRPGAVRDVVKEAAAGAGLDFVTLEEEFAKHRYRDIALPFDQHPNELGRRLIGEVLYRHLVEGSFLAME